MTFEDKWGTVYPENVRKFVNPGKIVDINTTMMMVASEITKDATTTDEAILDIHAFIKNIMNVDKIPVVIDVPVRKATKELERLITSPGERNFSHNKSILETALFRSMNIPARVATFYCDFDKTPNVMSFSRKQLNLKASFHNATEVFTTDKDGANRFKLKESWIPESKCELFDGACTVDERTEWLVEREIKGLQRHARCQRVKSGVDYPRSFSMLLDLGRKGREYSHVLDILDPVDGDPL